MYSAESLIPLNIFCHQTQSDRNPWHVPCMKVAGAGTFFGYLPHGTGSHKIVFRSLGLQNEKAHNQGQKIPEPLISDWGCWDSFPPMI